MATCDSIIDDYELVDWKNQVSSIILQPVHRNHILRYTRFGEELINDGFRNKKLSAYAFGIYNGLASVISSVPKLPKDIVVYRGVINYNNLNQVPVGTVLNMSGFTSTSLSIKDAHRFAAEEKPIMLRITIPHGVNVLMLQRDFGTSAFNECEILLPLNAVLQVTNIEKQRLVLDFIQMIDAVLIGFNTPTSEQLVSMYDDADDRIYEKLTYLQSMTLNKIVINDMYFRSGNKAKIYKAITTRKNNFAYEVNMTEEMIDEVSKIAQNRFILSRPPPAEIADALIMTGPNMYIYNNRMFGARKYTINKLITSMVLRSLIYRQEEYHINYSQIQLI